MESKEESGGHLIQRCWTEQLHCKHLTGTMGRSRVGWGGVEPETDDHTTLAEARGAAHQRKRDDAGILLQGTDGDVL